MLRKSHLCVIGVTLETLLGIQVIRDTSEGDLLILLSPFFQYLNHSKGKKQRWPEVVRALPKLS